MDEPKTELVKLEQSSPNLVERYGDEDVALQPTSPLVTDAPQSSLDPATQSPVEQRSNLPDISAMIGLIAGVLSLLLAYQTIPAYISLTTNPNVEGLGRLGAAFGLGIMSLGSIFTTLPGLIFSWLALAYQNQSDSPRFARRVAIIALLFQAPTVIFFLYLTFFRRLFG